MNKYDIVFESDNIYYIKLSESLISDYLKMVNDPDIAKMISHENRIFTYEQEKEWINEKLKNDSYIFSMIEKSTGEYIGNIEFLSITNNIGEIGIAITANKQNMHYGKEALKRIIEYGYNELNLEGFELNVYDINARAIHCYENVGFIKNGRGKEEDDIHMILKK